MADLFEGYGDTRVLSGSGAPFDEMFAGANTPRAPYGMVHEALSQMSRDELRGRTESLATSYLAQGVTFDFAGEERPFPSMLFLG